MLAQEFVGVSQRERDRILLQEEERQQRELDNIRKLLEEEQKAREAEEAKRKAEQKAIKSAQLQTVAVTIASVIIVSSGSFVLWRQRDLQIAFYDVWSGLKAKKVDTKEVLNDLLLVADKHREAAETSGGENNISRAIAYYRQIRGETNRRLYDVKNNQHKNQGGNDKYDLESLSNKSDFYLNYMLQKYRLPILEKNLEKARKTNNFGRWLIDKRLIDFEQQYTPSPLRTTYEIVMRELGAKADQNNDGKLESQTEADVIPCETLKKIQELWRNATDKRCDWYNPKATTFDPDTTNLAPECHELEGKSLTQLVFSEESYFPVQRLNFCQIAPQDLQP